MINGKTEITSAFCFKKIGMKEPLLEIKTNGDIFIKGELVKNDIEVANEIGEHFRKNKIVPKEPTPANYADLKIKS